MVTAAGLKIENAAYSSDRAQLLGNLHVLPDDIIRNCLHFLSPEDFAIVSLVCRKLRVLSDEESLWRFLCQRDFPHQTAELPPKLHYQICYNIHKERYAVMEPGLSLPHIIPIKGNQTIHWYPETARKIGLFHQGSSLILPLPPQADLNNLYIEWNGNQLAVACLVGGVPSVQIFGIQEKKLEQRQTLPIQTVGFLWVGKQLVTASVSKGHVVVEIWNPDAAGNLHILYSCAPPDTEWVVGYLNDRQENRQAYEDSNFYNSLAWDGQWLALPHESEQDEIGIHVWKVSEGHLKKEAYLEDNDSGSGFLRWKGPLLFIRNGAQIKIWDRAKKDYCSEIDCSGLSHEDACTTDIQIHGNQLFVACGNTISLWEADQNGKYTFVFSTFHTFNCNVLNFHGSDLYVRADLRGRMFMLDFSASHQEILQSLRAELQELIKWDSLDEESRNRGFEVIYHRLLKLPPSKTKPILEALGQMTPSSSPKRRYENLVELPLKPLQLIQAIDNYLEKTKSK